MVIAPSAIRELTTLTKPRAMTPAEIARTIDECAAAADDDVR